MFLHSSLIIDDDAWMRRILCKILLPEGFEKCHHASNGYEGIAKATLYLPTIILLDIEMPELDGKQTLRILKQMEHVKHIPVLVVSGVLTSEIVSEVMDLGAASIVGKPFTATTIHNKLIQIFGEDGLNKISNQQPIVPIKLTKTGDPFSTANIGENEQTFSTFDYNKEFDIDDSDIIDQSAEDELNILEKTATTNIPQKEAAKAYKENLTKNKNVIKDLIENLSKE